jgi:hypothetical protein
VRAIGQTGGGSGGISQCLFHLGSGWTRETRRRTLVLSMPTHSRPKSEIEISVREHVRTTLSVWIEPLGRLFYQWECVWTRSIRLGRPATKGKSHEQPPRHSYLCDRLVRGERRAAFLPDRSLGEDPPPTSPHVLSSLPVPPRARPSPSRYRCHRFRSALYLQNSVSRFCLACPARGEFSFSLRCGVWTDRRAGARTGGEIRPRRRGRAVNRLRR